MRANRRNRAIRGPRHDRLAALVPDGGTWIMRIGRILALAYMGIAAVMFSLQARIIFPGHETQGQPYAEVRPRPGTELVRLETRRHVPIVALYGPALTADGRPDPARCRAADAPLLLRQRDVPEARDARVRAVPAAGPERPGPRIRRLRDERRQPVRTRLPGHGRRGLRVPGRDAGNHARRRSSSADGRWAAPSPSTSPRDVRPPG